MLVDLADVDGQAAPADRYAVLLDELGQYRPELLDRPRVVVGSRADVAAARRVGRLRLRRRVGIIPATWWCQR